MKPRAEFGEQSEGPLETRRAFLLLAILLVAAGALRLWRLDAGWFGIDQARDAAWAESIASGGAWPDAGPAMRNRIRLGSTYYLFWAIPAFVVDSPIAGYVFAAMLGTVAVAGAAALAWCIAGPTAGLVAVLWLGFHPAAVIDSRVAWAPAAVPAACALFLWAGREFLRAPGRAGAALVGFVSGFATQLHLAAVALLPVAAGTLFSRLRRIGREGLLFAAGACALVLLPMAAAMRHPIPLLPGASATADATATVSPYAYRLLDFLFIVPRFLSGLTLPYDLLPWSARIWIPLEIVATVAPLVAVGWLALRTRSVREPATLRLVLATFVATTAIPLALPTDVWCYYLDGRLVAGAIAVGASVALARNRWLLLALGVIAVCRTALLAWWVGSAARQGWIPANLDYLRVGGPRPATLAARAQLLTVASRQDLAGTVVDMVGAADRPLGWDLHGIGADDLDGDNGYFLLREARERGPLPATGKDVLVLKGRQSERIPPAWIDGFSSGRSLRTATIFDYVAVLHPERGAIEGCATGPLPAPPPPDPTDYRAGEQRHAVWPCANPVVRMPFDASPEGIAVRVFPRLSGPGQVEVLSVDPPVEALRSGVFFLGDGVLLPRTGGELRLRLALEGPATLDMVELHGRSGMTPRPERVPGSPGSPKDAAPANSAESLRVDAGSATSGEG